MANLKDPMTFAELQKRSGWLAHGEAGNWWNEHVNCALALWCDATVFQKVRTYAEAQAATGYL